MTKLEVPLTSILPEDWKVWSDWAEDHNVKKPLPYQARGIAAVLEHCQRMEAKHPRRKLKPHEMWLTRWMRRTLSNGIVFEFTQYWDGDRLLPGCPDDTIQPLGICWSNPVFVVKHANAVRWDSFVGTSPADTTLPWQVRNNPRLLWAYWRALRRRYAQVYYPEVGRTKE